MWKLPEFISEGELTDKPLIILLVMSSILQTTITYSPQNRPRLTNRDVLTLLDCGLPDRVVLRAIEAAENDFDISDPAMKRLQKDGVSGEVVDAMVRVTLLPRRT